MSDAVAVVDHPNLDALAASGPVEVLAGVHAANQANRIVDLLEIVATALETYAPSRRVGLLVADAGSQDGTADVVRAWREPGGAGRVGCCLDVIANTNRGRAVGVLLQAARRLGARALVLLDADLAGVRKDWVQALLEPVLHDDADYVSPAYARSMAEGTLTTNLLAPLTRALYGGGLQQVMGGCAAIAGAAIGSWLLPDTETGDWRAHGTEIWLATAALASGARIVEVQLDRKLMTPGGPQPDLATILVRTVGPLFALMERYEGAWLDAKTGGAVLHRGDTPPVQADTQSVDVERMVRAFDLGLKDLLPVWEQIMPESTLAQLYPLALLQANEFQLPPRLWTRIVSDFAMAYHEQRLPRDHLLRALTPLYLGRVAAFMVQVRATPPERIPETFQTIERAFDDEKEHLVARWR